MNKQTVKSTATHGGLGLGMGAAIVMILRSFGWSPWESEQDLEMGAALTVVIGGLSGALSVWLTNR